MIIYQNTKAGFLDDVFTLDIEEVIHKNYTERTGRRVSPGEVASWTSSLIAMGRVLNTPTIAGDCGLAIEYTIPQTSKRVDVLLTGLDAGNQKSVVIVELKQWSEALATHQDAVVETRFRGRLAKTTHPSYQAWSYASLLSGFNEAVYSGAMNLHPCAYLHNYEDAEGALLDPRYRVHLDRAPVFIRGEAERNRLREFITRHLRIGDAGQIVYEIENGRIRPSKSLAEALVGMIRHKPEFTLIDEQKVTYEAALATACSMEPHEKNVVLIQGGPGTGKSVVAVNLLVELIRRRLTARYVTKNAAPRAVYESHLVGHMRKTEISHMFTSSGSFLDTPANTYDALIVDEAHRLNERSGPYGNLGDNQVKELIDAARTAVFFLDEDQRVTLKDIGSREAILHFSKQAGARVTELKLTSQFRCNGSDGYLAWLDHTLGIRSTVNTTLDPTAFDFQVFDSPNAMHDEIKARNAERNRARMVAGYCWDWKTKKQSSGWDIEIPDHGYRARWNLTKDGSLWMVSPDSITEVGCIHTCQGLEVDYIGVIIGDDLVVRDGQIVTRPEARAKTDHSLRGWKKLAQVDPEGTAARVDLLIKNTYRTLMTRGMKGCYVYCTDEETGQWLREAIGPGPSGPPPSKYV